MLGQGSGMEQIGCLCSSDNQITQVDIRGDGRLVGIVGLQAIFEQLYVLGRPPQASVQEELLAMVKARSYVPRSAEQAYRSALMQEYVAYCATKQKKDGRE